MPQFDTSTFISQVFWLAICLGMVIFCYVRIFIPKFNQTIEKRLSKIRYDLEQAEHMHEQATMLFEKNKKRIDDAQKQIEEQLKNTLADLEAKRKIQLTHINDELSGSLKAMEKSFEGQQLHLQESLEPIANDCFNQILHHIINKPAQKNDKPLVVTKKATSDQAKKKVHNAVN